MSQRWSINSVHTSYCKVIYLSIIRISRQYGVLYIISQSPSHLYLLIIVHRKVDQLRVNTSALKWDPLSDIFACLLALFLRGKLSGSR